MGAISRFDLGRIVSQFGANAYIETGVGMGVNLTYAAQFFAHVSGCEANRDVFNRYLARPETESVRRRVCQMQSTPFLLAVPNDPAPLRPLFFLNAHRVNGADPVVVPGSHGQSDFPLAQNLDVLLTKPWIGEAMIVIDAARLYQDTECFGGAAPENIRPSPVMRQEVATLLEKFANTHRFDLLPHDDAYLVLLPWSWDVGAWDLALVRRGDRYTRSSLQPGVAGATSISMMRRVHDARFATRYFCWSGY